MNSIKLCVVILASFVEITRVYSQKSYCYHLTTNDGLPSNKVYSVVQDTKGFMWFGTDNGAVRYDGARMVHFNVSNGLPDNDVYTVFEDNRERLWILCFKQAPCFFLDQTLHTVHNDTFLKNHFSSGADYKFCINRRLKRILFYKANVQNKIELIEYGKSLLLPLAADYHIRNSYFQFFRAGEVDFLFVNMTVVNLEKLSTQHYNPHWYQTSTDQFRKNNQDFALVYAFMKRQISINVKEGDTLREISIQNAPRFLGPFLYKNQPFFLDSASRIFVLDTNTFQLRPTAMHIPSADAANAYFDNFGNLWVNTLNDGVYMLPSTTTEILADDLDKNPTCFLEHKGTLYVGSENRNILLISPNKAIKKLQVPVSFHRLKKVANMCVVGDYIYIAGDFRLVKMDVKSGTMTPMHKGYGMLQGLKDMEVDKDGNLLIASGLGAGIFSPKIENLIDTFWMERTTSISQDNDGKILLGTLNGLYRWSRDINKVSKWITRTELDKARITDIRTDGRKRIWIGTAQYGLFIYANGKFSRLSNSQHSDLSERLTSYYIKNIFFDTDNNAWISTDRGLNRIETTPDGELRVQRITKAIGLPDDNINAAYTSNDTVYTATASGLFRFVYSWSLFSEKLGCEISSLWINFQPIALGDLHIFHYYQNNFSVEFSFIAIRSAANIGYKYRLLGLDTNWHLTLNNRMDFMALPPDDYSFEVQAMNLVTGETSPIRRLEFTIKQAWFRTTEFILFSAGVIALIIGFIIFSRMRRLRRAAEGRISVNKKLAEFEMQALRAQMNPHFIFNALTAIQNFYVHQKEREGNLYMSRFAGLIRQSLNLSKENMIRLEEEIQFLENYMELEIMRFQGKLTYECKVDPEIDTSAFFIPTMMIQPILENAVNHGIRPSTRSGKIELLVFMENDALACVIKDDGIGINRSKSDKAKTFNTHKSKGMFILQSRIQSLEAILQTKIRYEVQDISDIDASQTGTIVSIYFDKKITLEPSI